MVAHHDTCTCVRTHGNAKILARRKDDTQAARVRCMRDTYLARDTIAKCDSFNNTDNARI